MRRIALAVATLTLLAACSSSSSDGASPSTTDSATTTTAAPTTTTTKPAGPSHYQAVVRALADDAMQGRNNTTPGSVKAQDYLIGQLREFTEPLGDDYRHPFADGTNLVGVIPGGELRDEYVILGAHYDHLGDKCSSAKADDKICNGAADNAAGVASALEIGRRLAAGDPPRRSVIIALWDAEENGLLGSSEYVRKPLVPLAATTAYVNWDIQGTNLLPSLANTTIVVGAETGGPNLVSTATDAIGASDLDAVRLSLLFGQGRSDHAVFAQAKVPAVFFTDSTSACYHTAQDDLTTIDLTKLGREIEIGAALARDLVATDDPPAYAADAPVASYEDAKSMSEVVRRAQPDFGRFPAEARATVTKFLADLQTIIAAGEDAFGPKDVATVLSGSATVVELLTEGTCDGYLG